MNAGAIPAGPEIARRAKIGVMAPTPPERRDHTSGPLTGMRWVLESPDDHWARHDREQVRYWLSRPPAERLARAASYRMRVYREGPYTLRRTCQWLPSVVSSPHE
jgi:hypothetical protein